MQIKPNQGQEHNPISQKGEMNRNVNESRRRSKNEIVIRSRKRKIALRTQKRQNRKTKTLKQSSE